MSNQAKKAQTVSLKEVRKGKVKAASIQGFKIPQNPKEWQRYYQESNLNNSSIHSIDVMESASNCTDSQYIALRCHTLEPRTPDWLLEDLEKFGLGKAKKEADELLKNSPEFQNYIKLVSDNLSVQSLAGEKDKRWLGSWTAVRQLQEKLLWEQANIDREHPSDDQMEVDEEEEATASKGKKAAKLSSYGDEIAVEPLSSWSMQREGPAGGHQGNDNPPPHVPGDYTTGARGKKRPASKPLESQNRDESVANAGLIIFLETVGNLYLQKAASECHWELDHVDVGPTFHKGPEGSYTAKVDGVLSSMKNHQLKAIVEVKKSRRDKGYRAIVKEEVCQMAGFLRTTADTKLQLNGQ